MDRLPIFEELREMRVRMRERAKELGLASPMLSKADGISFDEWCSIVDGLVMRRTGVGLFDLADLREAYDSLMTAREGSDEAIASYDTFGMLDE